MKDFRLSIKNQVKNYIVLFLLVLFLGTLLFDKFIKVQNENGQIINSPISSLPAEYPLINRVLGTNTSDTERLIFSPDVTAHAAVAMDSDSKVILFSKNINLRFSPASTTKIMTALTGLDYYKLNDILTIRTDNVEPVVVGFKLGEQVTFESLLYGMLLPSGNDAALAIAQNYPGGQEAFVEKMNQKAKDFHLINTIFFDPIGLMDNSDHTTVLELARLASIAIQNETFSKIVSTKYRIISNIDGSRTYSLTNLNQLLGTNGVNGIKTGYTDEAGGVLVTSKVEKGHTIIIVVMKSQDRFLDTQKIINSLADNITYLSIHP